MLSPRYCDLRNFTVVNSTSSLLGLKAFCEVDCCRWWKILLRNMSERERHWKKRSAHEIEFRLCDVSIQSWILIVWLHQDVIPHCLKSFVIKPFFFNFQIIRMSYDDSHRCKIHHIKKGQDRWTDGRFACQMYSPLIFNNIDNIFWDNIEVLPVLLFRYWDLIYINNILDSIQLNQ